MAQTRPSRTALRRFLTASGCGQTRLAEALGVTQQQISALLVGRDLSEDLAKLIEEATGVPWKGWFTATELRKREDEAEAKLARARAFRAAFPVSSDVYA